MKRLLLYMLLGSVAVAVIADNTNAKLKAEYEAVHSYIKSSGNPTEEIRKWILQMAQGKSYYYNAQTFYIDSLKHDPNGKAMLDAAFSDALNEFTQTGADAFKIMEDKGLMPQGNYKCLKNFEEEKMTVWDSNMGDHFRYPVPMDDLVWEMCDSTKVILNYKCQMAVADYHGRRWTAWFAPDVPVQDGPWQLYGLPGLIMEANSVDGEYRFLIKGLQQCDSPLKDPYERENIFIGKRKNFLKQKDYTRRNRSAHIAAMTNGAVKVNADYTGTDDFLETDYHE